jgi:hypothetical protein
MKNKLELIDWLEKERNKDQLELDVEKNNFINEIKKLKKTDLIKKEEPKEVKLTLWQRLKKVLMG